MKEIYEYPYQNLLLEDMEDEIWKDIPDYEGYYQVSNLGRIKSLARELNFYREGKYRVRRVLKCDKIIKQYSRKNMINSFTGKAVYHLTCSIKTESTLFSGSVARLVYRTFVKDINKSKQRIIISHYDEDSLNNHVNNLYPQTYTELNLRNIKAGRLRTPKINELPVDVYNKICKGKCISIAQYTLDGEFIGTYPSISNAVKKYNMSFSSIIKALKYSNRTCCGFIWKKINAEEKLTSPKLLQ